MGNTLLKETFIPKMSIVKKDSLVSLNSYLADGISLRYGIEMQVTKGLGYGKIREPGKRIRSTIKLREHLRNMHLRTFVKGAKFLEANYDAFLMYTNENEKSNGQFITQLKKELDEIGISLNQTFRLEKEREKTVPYSLYVKNIEEKDNQIQRLKKKLKGKSLISRIFG